MIGFVNAFDLLWLIGISAFNIHSSDTSNEPVDLAFSIFESKTGIDKALTPIIFLHGLSSSQKHWENIPQEIADKTKRRVFAIDARNHGDSSYSEYFSMNLSVEDLFQFMDSRNISKAVLVGHSMGGRTAIQAALSKPERIETIFVEDTHLTKHPQATMDAVLTILQLRKESLLHLPRGLNESEAMEFINAYIVKNIPKENPLHGKLDDLLKSRVGLKKKPDGRFDLNYNHDVIFRIVKDSYDSYYSDPIGQNVGPAYFMYGKLSPLAVQSKEEKIRMHFPNAELIEFPGAGHSIHKYFPDEFVSTIINNL